MRNSRDRDDDRGSRRSRDDDDSRSSRRGRDDDDDRGGRSGRASSSYQYQGRSKEDVKSRSERGGKDFDKFLKDSIKMYKVQDGDNTIRILPPTWPKAKHYGLDVWMHYGVGPDRQSFICNHKQNGEDCPICEERAKALEEGDEDYAKELEPKRRVLVYLIDRNNEREGLQAWAMPWTIDKDICKISVDKKSGEVLPIDHPEEGFDVEFSKTGQGARTKYEGVAIARRSSELGKSQWLDEAVDAPLPDQLVVFDYDHIKKAFGGGGSHSSKRDRDDDDDRPPRGKERSSRDDDERPSRGRSRDDDERSSRSSRSRDEDEDDSRGAGRGRSSSRSEPELSWDSIHEMTAKELDALVESQDLDINADDAESDEDLADWICEELKIKKTAKVTTRRSVKKDDDQDDDSPASKLRSMRRSRGD